MPNMNLDKSMDEIKKYELMVPNKIMKKAQAKFKAKAKDSLNQEKLVLSASTEGASLHIKQGGGVSDQHFTKQLNAAMHKEENYFLNSEKPEVAAPDDNIAKSEQAK